MTREEAIRILKNFSLCGVYHQLIHMNDTDSEAISMAIKALEKPEIIRCKDCKYNTGDHKCLNPDSFFVVPADDDFCSYAERREG